MHSSYDIREKSEFLIDKNPNNTNAEIRREEEDDDETESNVSKRGLTQVKQRSQNNILKVKVSLSEVIGSNFDVKKFSKIVDNFAKIKISKEFFDAVYVPPFRNPRINAEKSTRLSGNLLFSVLDKKHEEMEKRKKLKKKLLILLVVGIILLISTSVVLMIMYL